MFEDFPYVWFSVSGVRTPFYVPPLVAFVISTLTSTGGVSGAFLLLPFQLSYLKFTSPAVSSTNLVYNLVAIPSGVHRYIREGRMAWPLTFIVILGTLPGVFAGYYIRVWLLPDPLNFKVFVGSVLLYLGLRLVYDASGRGRIRSEANRALEEKFKAEVRNARADRAGQIRAGIPPEAVVRTVSLTAQSVVYEFWGERFRFSTPAMFALALAVGMVGGAYGIGGGAIIAPICVALFDLPVYTVAGAALLGTFLTSIAGVAFYSLVPLSTGGTYAPDWLLGILFGLGGVP
ncbi:MAG: sulfite exporter TauE/SafE family protein, partial [Acidobacteriota bacterium]